MRNLIRKTMPKLNEDQVDSLLRKVWNKEINISRATALLGYVPSKSEMEPIIKRLQVKFPYASPLTLKEKALRILVQRREHNTRLHQKHEVDWF